MDAIALLVSSSYLVISGIMAIGILINILVKLLTSFGMVVCPLIFFG
jgi:hypothetical protein